MFLQDVSNLDIDLNWRIGGEAGFGIMISGKIFSLAFSRGGYHVFDYTEYPSLIRGGHNVFTARISSKPVFCSSNHVDLLVALNKQTLDIHRPWLKVDGAVIYDKDETQIDQVSIGNLATYPLPLTKLAEQSGGRIMLNSVALGASIAVVGYDFSQLETAIYDVFKPKSRKVATENVKAAKSGYDYIRDNFSLEETKLKILTNRNQLLVTGNEAVAIGAIAAGCKFYAAYPMTPASSILHFFAAYQREFNLVVKHAEDEIAVVNMACGAAFAGVRSMVATSGGGFCLMTEGLGQAGIAEIPIVIVECQRPGPATGMPTWTEQGDLQFILNAAQGEFPRFVLAPGDVSECFYLAAKAFNLAEKYQTPVLIILDKHLSESHMTTPYFDLSRISIDRGELLTNNWYKSERYLRYKLTNSGVSPRSIPGQLNAVHLCNSYEHNEYGFASELSENRSQMSKKRWRKLELAKSEKLTPSLHGNSEANLTLISWGSTKGAILEAIKLLSAKGISANFLHLNCLSPFPSETVQKVLSKAKKTLLVEDNFTGQLGRLIREKTGIGLKNQLLKYDGRQFFAENLAEQIERLC